MKFIHNTKTGEIVNLSNIVKINILDMSHAFIISFQTVLEKYTPIQWHYKTRKERDDVYKKIVNIADNHL